MDKADEKVMALIRRREPLCELFIKNCGKVAAAYSGK